MFCKHTKSGKELTAAGSAEAITLQTAASPKDKEKERKNDMTELYNPENCPCTRGKKAACPRFLDCEACRKFHKENPKTPLTSCERLAAEEQKNA